MQVLRINPLRGWAQATGAGLVLLLLSVATVARAEVSESAAERVMRDSGMWEQVADLGPQLRQGFEQAAQRPPPDADPNAADGLRRLAQATDDAFGALSLRLAVRRELAARLDPQMLPAVQAWLASPQGRRITAREVAKSAEHEDSAARQQAGERVFAASSVERRALLQSFVEHTRQAEAASNTFLNLMLALQSGVARAMGRQDVPPLQVLRQQMEAQRMQMQQEVGPLVLALAADMYAPLPDADLKAYVDFHASTAGRHFTDVALQALDAAVAASAEELGRLVAPR